MSGAETIAAIATAAGAGGVGIVRISGPAAEAVLRAVVPGLPAPLDSHRLTLATARAGDAVLDEVLAVLMRAPRSYTGEDVAELHGHGGVVNLRRLLEAVVAAGARLAEPGEFTRRAYLAGRMDLTRAEAVADVVAAHSERALRIAQAQLAGELERRVRGLRAELTALLAEVEGAIDFPDEGLEALTRPELGRRAAAVAAAAAALAATHRAGRLIAGGLEVALVGAPNAGKSSLLNCWAGRERAVVSPEPGTTRDFLEARVLWQGVAVTLIDTPGERAGTGAAETRALELGHVRAAEADVRVWVVDPDEPPGAVPDASVMAVNKVDRAAAGAVTAALERARAAGLAAVPVSALSGQGVEALAALVLATAGLVGAGADDVVVTSARQHALLVAVAEAAGAAADGAVGAAADELVASDLRAALTASASLVGEGVGEDVIDAVFARFCIGK